nr:hypothetical protein [Nitrosomonas aestuarii]
MAIGTLIAALLKIVVSGLPVSIPWNFVMGALALSVVIGLAVSVVPAIRAAKLNPIDALRTE